MEDFSFEAEIAVIGVEASTFPEGVQDSHEILHGLVPAVDGRKYFGISWGSANGEIRYMAAAEIVSENDKNLPGTKPFMIKKGPYHTIVIHDFMRNIPAIGQTFNQLLKTEKLDPQGYCLEWYLDNTDVRCMVLVRE